MQRLAGAYEIAKTVINIPHPYEDGVAELWIDSTYDAFTRGRSLHLAVTLKDEDGHGHRPFIGAIGLEFNHQSRFAELGYWLGVPYWNKGYTTEAARALVAYGFEELRLNRIQARHMTNNPASGRVMQKIGMTYEGTHRQAAFRFGEYHDLAMYPFCAASTERPYGPEPGPWYNHPRRCLRVGSARSDYRRRAGHADWRVLCRGAVTGFPT